MPPKATLRQLIDLARMRSDTAARSLGTTRTREHQEVEKLNLLLEYRKEYLLRFDQAARTGLERTAWNNYHEFIAKLDAAIRQQGEVIEQLHRRVEQCRNEWQTANTRLKSFTTLDQRRLQAESNRERRHAQREQDEFANRPRGRQTRLPPATKED